MNPEITVVLCGDRAPAGSEESFGPYVAVIEGLCAEPDPIGTFETDDLLVLGLCRGDYSPGLVQALVGKAGHDGLATPILDLRSVAGDLARLEVMLAGVAAGAGVARTASDAKAVFSGALSRRDLLRFPQPEYVATPVIDRGVCSAGSGCQACVAACPRQAYEWNQGVITYDKDACEPCGICVTACPVDAISNAALAGLEAQIAALVDAGAGSVGIAFVCRRATEPIVADAWYPVEVPCNAMLAPHWLLATVAGGVGAVAAPLCSDLGCSLGYDAKTAANVEYCRQFLAAAGHDPDLVDTEISGGVPTPLRLDGPSERFTQASRPGVLTAFGSGERVVVEDHVAAPIGTIQIDPEVCTGCRLCAETCPTGALEPVEDEGTLVISFDANLCTACDQCTPRCPEPGAIALSRRTDLASLAAGRVTLYEEALLRCERCGNPIASSVMMDRFADLLGPEQESVMSVITRFCIDCRGQA